MADAKIINYGQPIGAGTTVIPDNQAVSLDIESTDGKEFVRVISTNSGERVVLGEGDGSTGIPVVIGPGDGNGKELNINNGSQSLNVDIGGDIYLEAGSAHLQIGCATASKDIVFYVNGTNPALKIASTGALSTGAESTSLATKGGIHLQTASDSISPDPTIVLVNGTASDDAKKRKCTIEFRGVGDSQAEHDLIKLEGHAIGGNNQGGNFDIMNNTGSGGFNITGHFDYNNTVGLGSWVANTTPSATVHIRRGGASLRLDNTAGADTAAARLAKLEFFGLRSGDEAVEQGQIHFAHEGTADDDKSYMVIETNDGTSSAERLRIDSAGKVGIGTTAAAAMLEAKGNLTTNLSDSTSTVSGTGDRDVASTAHGLYVGAAVADTGGNKYKVETRTDADNFVVDSDTGGNGIEGQWTTDPDLFAVKTGHNGTATFTTYEYTIKIGGDQGGKISFARAGGVAINCSHGSGELYFQMGGANKMKLDANGDLGIATTNPVHKIDVVGTAGLSTGTAWTNTSDSRIKQDVQSIDNALEKINALRPVSFRYTDEYLEIHPEIDGSKTYNSFIAQEYATVFPDAVTASGNLEKVVSAGDGGVDEVREVVLENLQQFTPHDLNMYLVRAVQEMSARIEELENGE